MSGSAVTGDPAADLLSAVAQAYGLTAPFRAQRLSGGYANDVFLLDGERPVVLHLKHPPLDLNSLSWEHQLLERLGVRLPEIPISSTHPRRANFPALSGTAGVANAVPARGPGRSE